MIVARVPDATGSHIEPALDPDWPELTKLEWKAAVTQIDTGLRINIHEIGPDRYAVTVGGSSSSSRSYYDAWDYLTAVTIGAQEAQRATGPRVTG